MIDLYTWGTPNGRKVSIMLEAIGVEYNTQPIDITAKQQFSAEFLSMSPNNKIPAITDYNGPDGQPISLFESGAILIYLAEKTAKFIPENPVARLEVLQWLMWQMGGFGPMLGQAHHFNHFVTEDIPYPKQRYLIEAKRLWSVLDTQLTNKQYVVNQISIADFAIYPWCARYAWQAIDPKDYPNVYRWMQQMASLDFVARGMLIPAET
ncbi:MAG: glutathione S-transferase N-terminal domain-containing protein [Pseudomonadales bacterium]|nr:glutathione S-transferase N-terminal domain-containing protein [Pseudomonadales bacterium]